MNVIKSLKFYTSDSIDHVAAYFTQGGPRRSVSILDSDCALADCQTCPDEVPTSLSSYDEPYHANNNCQEPICRCNRPIEDPSSSFHQLFHKYEFQPAIHQYIPSPVTYDHSTTLHHYLNHDTRYDPLINPSLINLNHNNRYSPGLIPQYDPIQNYIVSITQFVFVFFFFSLIMIRLLILFFCRVAKFVDLMGKGLASAIRIMQLYNGHASFRAHKLLLWLLTNILMY